MKVLRRKPQTSRTKVLVLDVGFRNTGYAVYDYACHRVVRMGVLTTTAAKHSLAYQNDIVEVRTLSRALRQLIQSENWLFVAAELPHSGGQSSRAVRLMAMASAIVHCATDGLKVPYLPFMPNDTKQLVNAVGKHSNKAVVEAIMGHDVLPPLRKHWEHIADALLVLILVNRSSWLKNLLCSLRLTPFKEKSK